MNARQRTEHGAKPAHAAASRSHARCAEKKKAPTDMRQAGAKLAPLKGGGDQRLPGRPVPMRAMKNHGSCSLLDRGCANGVLCGRAVGHRYLRQRQPPAGHGDHDISEPEFDSLVPIGDLLKHRHAGVCALGVLDAFRVRQAEEEVFEAHSGDFTPW